MACNADILHVMQLSVQAHLHCLTKTLPELRRLSTLQVPLYTAEIVERYVNRGTPRDGSEQPEPHVFLTADTAYKAMARNNASQSLVITGESGSGKTETTKIAMQVGLCAY